MEQWALRVESQPGLWKETQKLYNSAGKKYFPKVPLEYEGCVQKFLYHEFPVSRVCSCSHRTHVALQTDPPLPSMPCRELATECTPGARWHERCTAPREDVKISFRFHSCFKISLATGCMGIYFPWMDNAPRRASVCAHRAPKGHSLVNKGLTDFNLQRCQADLRKPGSWYINSAEGPIVNLHFMHRYGEIYGCGFRAFVQVLHLQVAITTAILWLYSWTLG